MKPALVTIPPRELRDRLQNDPTLLALLAQGYTIGTSCVLVDGPDGPEQRMEFALVLVPPVAPAPLTAQRWLAWGIGVVLLIQLCLLVCAVALAV